MTGNKASISGRHRSAVEYHSNYENLEIFFAMFNMFLEADMMKSRLSRTMYSNFRVPGLQDVLLRLRRINDQFFRLYSDVASQAGRFLHFSGGATFGGRFCVTEQDRMANVTIHCVVGDVICIIKSARMLYVLRKKSDEYPLLYNVASCCYLHGVIDGEI
jgi:hypothetical protein